MSVKTNEMKISKLSYICEIEMGQSPTGNDCNNEGIGVPLLNGPTEFRESYPLAVQYTTAPKRMCKKGDLLFCVRGSTTGRMNWADREYAIGRGLAAIRHAHGNEYKHFLKALLDTKLSELLSSATGSTFPNIGKDLLNSLKVKIPCLPSQKHIAKILGCLVDKIELNNHINDNLAA